MVTRDEFREHAKLHIFGVSFNSAKAHLALRISSQWKGSEVRMLDIVGTNYEPEFAKLNPNMTVPTCEIDDKLISDSDVMLEYLRTNYPGVGDQEVASNQKDLDLKKMCDIVKQWDEGMYTYGRMSGAKGGGMGAASNELRLIRLRQARARLVNPNEKLYDGSTIAETYEKKIAYIQNLSSKVDVGMTPEKKRAFDLNLQITNQIWAEANQLLINAGWTGPNSETGFLFGQHLTTADCYFAPLVFRMEEMDKADLEEHFQQFPAVRDYWAHCKKSIVVQECITKFTMSWAMKYAARKCIPCAMFCMKLGCLRAPKLPEDVEKRIREFQQSM